MVLLINICVGQRVEVKHEEKICKGTVRYKGGVGNRPGEWVGVELDLPVGNHNGILYGRHYFQCPDKHGIFADANDIRFQKLKRCLFNRYKTIPLPVGHQEDLFSTIPAPEKPDIYKKKNEGGFLNTRERQRPQTGDYRLTTRISNTVAPVTKSRPSSSRLPYKWDLDPLRLSSREHEEEDVWISTPTVPKTHMPHSVQSYLTRKGWGEHRLIRESSVATFRDNFQRRDWNNIAF